MRIAIINWSNRRIGGPGTYLSAGVPKLQHAGHESALWHEVNTPVDYDPIPMPSGAPVWSMTDLGLEPALAALSSWQPDLLYAHGLLDPAVERRTLQIAPSVFFAHNYRHLHQRRKTFVVSRDAMQPRSAGSASLITIRADAAAARSRWSSVRQQRDRALLSRKSAIVTHSTHMRQGIKHGLSWLASSTSNGADGASPASGAGIEPAPHDGPWGALRGPDGRSGGRELIQALPDVVRRLNRDIRLTCAGDGPARAEWEKLAHRVCRVESRAQVLFTGWLPRASIDTLFSQSDLLVLPSLWPEPLALVGLEAARHRLPVAAFAVGGISDWLTSGHNGFLAPGNPPTIDGLVLAIVACLKDAVTHARLRDGAAELSADFAFEKHIELLLRAFDDATKAPQPVRAN
jgi:glycosyltransferase involved in cell wall biosynthesis